MYNRRPLMQSMGYPIKRGQISRSWMEIEILSCLRDLGVEREWRDHIEEGLGVVVDVMWIFRISDGIQIIKINVTEEFGPLFMI